LKKPEKKLEKCNIFYTFPLFFPESRIEPKNRWSVVRWSVVTFILKIKKKEAGFGVGVVRKNAECSVNL
jgi:hypothetical protein